jgi:hypothetical protein
MLRPLLLRAQLLLVLLTPPLVSASPVVAAQRWRCQQLALRAFLHQLPPPPLLPPSLLLPLLLLLLLLLLLRSGAAAAARSSCGAALARVLRLLA